MVSGKVKKVWTIQPLDSVNYTTLIKKSIAYILPPFLIDFHFLMFLGKWFSLSKGEKYNQIDELVMKNVVIQNKFCCNFNISNTKLMHMLNILDKFSMGVALSIFG